MSQPAAQQLYNWLEVKFDPLKLAAEIDSQLKSLGDLGKIEYVQYVDSLKQVTALKVLKQVQKLTMKRELLNRNGLKETVFRFRKFIKR